MPKCPLNMALTTFSSGRVEIDKLVCIKADCAIYDENADRCAILELSRELYVIGNVLGRIDADLQLDRYTFRCHSCGQTVTASPGNTGYYPNGWSYEEQVDGKHVWLCARCP